MRYLDPVVDRHAIVTATFYDDVIEGIMDVLVVAGVRLASDAMRGRIEEVFGERISAVVLQTVELRKIVGEDMLSSEFEILCPRHSHRFQEEWMEDAEGAGSPRDHGHRSRRKHTQTAAVLCTTELGLSRHEKKSTDGPNDNVESRVIIKAKVMLSSVVDEFVRQQQHKASTARKALLMTPPVSSCFNCRIARKSDLGIGPEEEPSKLRLSVESLMQRMRSESLSHGVTRRPTSAAPPDILFVTEPLIVYLLCLQRRQFHRLSVISVTSVT